MITPKGGIYDGRGVQSINIPAYFLHVDLENIYFSSPDNCIYHLSYGGKAEKIISNCYSYFEITEKSIYYEASDNEKKLYLYRANLDGTGAEKLFNHPLSTGTFCIGYTSDYKQYSVYFIAAGDDNAPTLFCIDEKGELKKLDIMEATAMQVFGSHLYFYHPSYGGRLSLLDLDTNTITDISAKAS